MRKYDFDNEISRSGTGAMMVDGLKEMFGRKDLTALWIADMDFAVCPEITKALNDRIKHPIYGYPNVPDSYWQSIIDWLKRRHGWAVTREELTYIPGVVKGLGFAINFFSNPGDKIVIQPPVYHPFKMVTEGNGRELVTNPLVLDADGNYQMDLDGLESIFCNSRPKMMILCNPHNPAGIQWDNKTLQCVARLAKKYGVVVVSDEIHADLMLYGKPHFPYLSSCPEAEETGIAFSAPSKTFNIAGLVSSWCVIKNPALREPFYKWLSVNEFNAPTFMAMVATEVAYNEGEEWLDQLLKYIEGNVAEVERLVAEKMPRIKVIRPQASFLVWLDCRGLGLSHSELVDLFVNKAHLALNDGAMFGSEGVGFMRLNVGEPRCAIRRALIQLAEAID